MKNYNKKQTPWIMEKGLAIIDSHLSAIRDLALYDEEVRPCPQRIPDFYVKAEDRQRARYPGLSAGPSRGHYE